MEKKAIALSQALEGYFLFANARRLSPNTLDQYDWAFRKLERHLQRDPPFASITQAQLQAFIHSLDSLSKKSVLHVHVALSALWAWGVQEHLVPRNIVRDVTPPRPEKRAIIPYTKQDLQLMLAACDRSRGYQRPGKRRCDHSRPTALRDRAIIKVLADTGVRATELCQLQVRHADLRNGRITVMGKGDKQRYVHIGPRTTQSLWRYLASREDPRPDAPLFSTDRSPARGRPMERHALRRLINRIGHRAGVPNAHPHRFRHTFAINYLRNGANIFALQEALGHASMTMVQRYLRLAEADLDKAHQLASPVENWLL